MHIHNTQYMAAVTVAGLLGLGRVLRFEFSDDIIKRLRDFVVVHNYDDRKTYKEAWSAWLAHDEIAALINAEVARLSALGYTGDVSDKLFKSGRYYFRQKTDGFLMPVGQAPPRKYVLLNRQLLDAMDDHIERGLRQNAHAYTPASGFADFCKTWMNDDDSYIREVTRLSELMPTGEAVHEKLKKTYKNRYFMMTKNRMPI
jgi:hypothetical protein